jgi:uncharacterized membrane protein YfcA
MPETFLLYLLLGCCAGLLSGLFGIGGGVAVVPFLAWLFAAQDFASEYVMHMAVATSLASITVTSVAAVHAHHRLGVVDWRTVYRLAPGILAGSALGSVIADRMPVDLLRAFFAVFLLFMAVQMALAWKPLPGHRRISSGSYAAAGGAIGALSAMLGIGGGTLTVPFLVKYRFPIHNAVAISNACGFPIAVAGSLSYVALGWHKAGFPPWSLGYVHLPAFLGIIASSVLFAPLGVKLAHRLPTTRLKRLFALLLLIVGFKLLAESLS